MNYKPEYVYLIYDYYNETYKIGVSKNILRRIKLLLCGNSSQLEMVAYHETYYPYKIENMLHNRFKLKNVLNEWYYLDSSIRELFIPLCEEYEKIIETMKDNPFFFKKKLTDSQY